MFEGLNLIFDQLFRGSFFTGLSLAIVLPIVGCYLRMREQWLAALGLSQIAAAGGVAGTMIGIPPLFSATIFAGIVLLIKGLYTRIGNSHYALMIVLGWALTILLGANSHHHGELVGDALLKGQLYFTTNLHLLGAITLLIVSLLAFPFLNRRLLIDRFFPDYFSANLMPAWHHGVVFGLVTLFTIVLGTIALGAFPAFAHAFYSSMG
jgi:zinc/manganese transport system permease protein